MSSINNMSLYIPHIFDNFTKDYVASVFEKCLIGKVEHIDFISKLGKDGKTYNAAYIHFEYWFENSTAERFQERILDGKKEARLVYDDPWYWIVLENKARKFIPGDRKPRIDLGDSTLEDTSANTLNPIYSEEYYALGQKKFLEEMAIEKEKEDFKEDLSKMLVEMSQEVSASKMQDEMAECQAAMEEDFELAEYEANMEDCEQYMQEDDQYLASFDWRYVQQLEQENMSIRMQLNQLQCALFAEQTRVLTLFDSLKIVSQEKTSS
jgi:hypothetical protein